MSKTVDGKDINDVYSFQLKSYNSSTVKGVLLHQINALLNDPIEEEEAEWAGDPVEQRFQELINAICMVDGGLFMNLHDSGDNHPVWQAIFNPDNQLYHDSQLSGKFDPKTIMTEVNSMTILLFTLQCQEYQQQMELMQRLFEQSLFVPEPRIIMPVKEIKRNSFWSLGDSEILDCVSDSFFTFGDPCAPEQQEHHINHNVISFPNEMLTMNSVADADMCNTVASDIITLNNSKILIPGPDLAANASNQQQAFMPPLLARS